MRWYGVVFVVMIFDVTLGDIRDHIIHFVYWIRTTNYPKYAFTTAFIHFGRVLPCLHPPSLSTTICGAVE